MVRPRSLGVKERDVVRIRDCRGGRMTYLLWRKRRYRCESCERTFTETHPQLPSRQRVSARFRGRLSDRCKDGAAHAEVARDETHDALSGGTRLSGGRR